MGLRKVRKTVRGPAFPEKIVLVGLIETVIGFTVPLIRFGSTSPMNK
jgi:hypothetical protein